MNELAVIKDFEKYVVKKHEHLGGVRYEFKFPNGFGASLVRVPDYFKGWGDGVSDDLIELAVLDDEGHLT